MMEKILANTDEIKLIGFVVTTDNATELNPATSKIGPLVRDYFSLNMPSILPNLSNPGVNIAAYTAYDNAENLGYTYYFGEQVDSLELIPIGLATVTLPAGKYIKFTTDTGPMPTVVIDAWREIWNMSEAELGGKRNFIADYEVYDERALNPEATVVDIYIGIE